MKLKQAITVAALSILAVSGACATAGETEEDPTIGTDDPRPAVMDTMARDTVDTMVVSPQ